ncbi:MAG: hypothetical protein COU35_02160 [Candidatus Magasanikbacteria bacterium CG10_big_fil_rev_8_21_14_0_10_47_10]|uniref:Uncharacterized protein n=1 Tax=Candidatus Magasanikbacteria bacterium CG10_big_fil_rev_8_21_14_0_10_47_10 TaxID=1974652 RepID=A0A2H0TQS9_9BACT|nr:MAG: hypothetical protein COU35_02160 [Candidatus Magasanikbacteria bacterium CG10_big_fil_rev_8_21_14_0_10_47_10]
MGQYIGVQVIGERGELLKDARLNVEDLVYKVNTCLKMEDFPFLCSIEEYANTVINPKQAKMLIEELKRLKSKEEFREYIVLLDKLIEIAGEIDYHHYLRFMGD